VLDTVGQVTGTPVPATVGPRRPGDPARLVASAARAGRELGWRPERSLADMVRDAWELAGR
jgi:UDP-glucose 4-epimerase